LPFGESIYCHAIISASSALTVGICSFNLLEEQETQVMKQHVEKFKEEFAKDD